MMELSVLSTTITEPVTVTEVKSFMGYPGDDQDTEIGRMIRVAREWLENHCGISVVNKQYKAYFEKEDAMKYGWYELPVSPVLSTPEIVVEVCGESIEFEQKGLNRVSIRPSEVYATVNVGSSSSNYYIEVTFNAGATNSTANEIIRKIVATMFNAREDGAGGDALMGRLPYDTLRLIETINQNVGL